MSPEWVTVWLVAIGMLGGFCLWLINSFTRKDTTKALIENLATLTAEVQKQGVEIAKMTANHQAILDTQKQLTHTAESLGHVAASLDSSIQRLGGKKKPGRLKVV